MATLRDTPELCSGEAHFAKTKGRIERKKEIRIKPYCPWYIFLDSAGQI
jgi:hypothetical protein